MSIFTARPKTAPALTIVTLTALALIGATTAAQAGFEWKGPAAAPKKPSPTITTTVGSTATGDMAGLEPVISWNGAVSETAMPAQKVDEVDVTAIITTPAPTEAAPQEVAAEEIVVETPMMTLLPATQAPEVTAPIVAEAEGADVLSGFGSDLPLVIALQQVVPAGYQYSFASGVNPGVSVSWDGGKVWQHVLADMLSAQSLGYKINNNTVVIGHYASPTVTTAPTRVLLSTTPEAPAYVPTKADQLPEDLVAPTATTSAPVLDTTPAATTTLPAPSSEPVYIRREKPSSLLKKSSADDAAKTTETVAAVEAAPVVAEAVVAETAVAEVAVVKNETPASKWIDSTAPVSLSAANEPAATAVEAAPVAVPAIPVAGVITGQWHASKGQTLRDALKKWSDTAGVELYWSIDYDFRLDSDVDYSGNYDEAVTKALDRFASSRPQPYGQLHQSSEGPRVLVVKSYDLTH